MAYVTNGLYSRAFVGIISKTFLCLLNSSLGVELLKVFCSCVHS